MRDEDKKVKQEPHDARPCLYSKLGIPRPQAGSGLWPVRNPASQQEVSGWQASSVFAATL